MKQYENLITMLALTGRMRDDFSKKGFLGLAAVAFAWYLLNPFKEL